MIDQEFDSQAMRTLAAHVFIKALEDSNRPDQRQSVRAFLNSKRLEWFADVLDLDPRRIRRRFAKGIDPTLVKYARRAHKGKNGGVLAERATEITNAPPSLPRQEAR